VLDLLRRPEAWRAVVADPSLVRNAVEESLRHEPFSKFGSVPRYALEDTEIRGTFIPESEMAVPIIPPRSATHEAPVFRPNPQMRNMESLPVVVQCCEMSSRVAQDGRGSPGARVLARSFQASAIWATPALPLPALGVGRPLDGRAAL
jgi:hypothetical protein